ncbi:MAG TPA: hypothetical protein VMA34_09860, partial [Terracidiphilus sp.]|nr:hypothetical protein [Terracidiphilus sp.]
SIPARKDRVPGALGAAKIGPYFVLAFDLGATKAFGLGFSPQRRRPVAGDPGLVWPDFRPQRHPLW